MIEVCYGFGRRKRESEMKCKLALVVGKVMRKYPLELFSLQ